ncbi:protein kinase domain-containing protein [Lacibacter sediminis]|uniref:AAA family ATPase n=1 Tax=Lacibacter sediminis TaxID=2760713 RepID=A0A7G5XFP9_9BACT|nr:AAA family ATPase [Lacibacter sediminis]QNA44302.1 AAA family ATPase [Lacibacter sediminis]
MSSLNKAILEKGFVLSETYTVLLFIKKSNTAETYRAKGKDGNLYFLKLFYYGNLNRSAFDDQNNILETSFLKALRHENIVGYQDSGEIIIERKKYAFLILNFIAGEALADRITREPISTIYDLKGIAVDVLKGLSYLHNLEEPIIHNEITPQNIMLDMSTDIPQARLIDFGHARSFHQSSSSYNKTDLNLAYIAPECIMANAYSPQSDLFSVGAVMYHLLTGTPPWFKAVSKFQEDRSNAEDLLQKEREKPLLFPGKINEIIDFDESIIKIIKKALHPDLEFRFQSADEFMQALSGQIDVEDVDKIRVQKSEKSETEKKTLSTKPKGTGFDSIAGMSELKRLLTVDVINALKDPEKYKKYDVAFPNGILFYGPPRCGKTYFAKKFAEEVGYNYMYIKPSTLKSRYVNATQENIAKMFEEAEKNAPTIIFIDELNELLPNRDSDVHEMTKSAVNEMLAQMDRTGDKGIFIVGATNYPLMIDPAILGAGRLEKYFYIGPPDFELRKSLFEVYLKKKPLDFGIDYEKLAKMTENYVTGDIELLVNEAARFALTNNMRVTMDILEKTIKKQKPTVPLAELKKYEAMRRKFEGGDDDEKTNERTPIGFRR